MKIIHTGDIHYWREDQERALASMRAVCETGEKEGIDLFVIAGDLFNRPVNNTRSSGFTGLVSIIQRMLNIAPIVAARGTPTHDAEGCYEVFQELEAKHRFTVLQPGKNYFLNNDGVHAHRNDHSRLLILGCPEPQKVWFLKDKQLGKEE